MKLNHGHLGPFMIVENTSTHAVWLGLTLALFCIDPIFHTSLLQPSSLSPIPKHVVEAPPPIKIDNEDEFEVNGYTLAGPLAICSGGRKIKNCEASCYVSFTEILTIQE